MNLVPVARFFLLILKKHRQIMAMNRIYPSNNRGIFFAKMLAGEAGRVVARVETI
jgi:hypothetical protein